MSRTSAREVRDCFRLLADSLGKARGTETIGQWDLDYAPLYGGYIIVEVHNEHGATSYPFGEGRLSAREFCDACRFALSALTVERRRHDR